MVTGFRRLYRNFGKLLAQKIQAGMAGQNSAALVTPTEVRSHSTELQDFIAPLQKLVGINLKKKKEKSLAFIASLSWTNTRQGSPASVALITLVSVQTLE